MKKILRLLIMATLIFGCNEKNAENEKRLLAKIDSLETLKNQMKKKGKMVAKALNNSKIASTVLDDFFNSDEFWENTYDVSLDGCLNTCGNTYSDQLDACAEETDPIEKEKCEELILKQKISCDSTCISQYFKSPIEL